MEHTFFLLLGAVFGVLIRVPFAIVYSSDSDRWGLRTRYARLEGRNWLDYGVPDALSEGVFAYPIFVHWLVAKFPCGVWGMVALVINIVPDIIQGWLVYGAIVWFFSDGGGVGNVVPFLGMLIALSLPVLLPLHSRMKAMNGRAPGMLFCGIHFILVGMVLLGHSPLWLAAAAVAAFLTVLSSLFGLQVLVFFSLLLTVAYVSVIPLLPLLGMIALGWVVPRIGVREVLLFKIDHLLWYLEDVRKVRTVSTRNLVKNFLLLVPVFFRDRERFRALILHHSPLAIALYSVPPVWLIAWVMIEHPAAASMVADEPVLRFAAALFLVSFLTFVVTSIPPFTVLGHAERYFEYSSGVLVALAVVLAILYLDDPIVWLTALFVVQLAITLAIHLYYNLGRLRAGLALEESDDEDCRGLASFLAERGDVRVATLPIKLPMKLSYFTHGGKGRGSSVRYYYRFFREIDGPIDGFSAFRRDTHDLNCFMGEPGSFRDRYGIDLVVGERSFLNRHRCRFTQGLDRFPVVFENASFVVYDLGVVK